MARNGRTSEATRLQISLAGEVGADGAQEALEVVGGPRPLEGEVKSLRITRQREEKTQRRAAVEGERRHCSYSLQAGENPRLKILPGHVQAVDGLGLADQLA